MEQHLVTHPVGQTLALELVGLPVLLLAILGAVEDLLARSAPAVMSLISNFVI